jgi:hypothetical protein
MYIAFRKVYQRAAVTMSHDQLTIQRRVATGTWIEASG